jgi:predicted lipoprotein with Yx(FWY)xxD motif
MHIRRFAVMVIAVMALAACAGAEEPAATGDEAGAETQAPPAEEETEAAPAGDETEAAPAEEETEAPPAEADAGAAAIEVASSDLGDILVDAEGVTLYVFDSDTDGTSTCYEDCAANWPALTGEVTAGEGVDESLLGTTERDDGETQVTYADRPLYYFAGDQAAGDTNGQGVGDAWWVMGPDGEAITGGGDTAAAGGDDTDSGY